MNELKAPYGRTAPTQQDADQPQCVGFRITQCAYEGCSWQVVEASDTEAFQHLVDEHSREMDQLWQFGRVEAA